MNQLILKQLKSSIQERELTNQTKEQFLVIFNGSEVKEAKTYTEERSDGFFKTLMVGFMADGGKIVGAGNIAGIGIPFNFNNMDTIKGVVNPEVTIGTQIGGGGNMIIGLFGKLTPADLKGPGFSVDLETASGAALGIQALFDFPSMKFIGINILPPFIGIGADIELSAGIGYTWTFPKDK